MEESVPAGRRLLRLNLDETAVLLYPGASPGTILQRADMPAQSNVGLVCHASLKQRRSALTHVAIVCDQPWLQPKLPQFLLADRKTVRYRDLARLQASLPPNVRLVRGKARWVDSRADVAAPTVRRAGIRAIQAQVANVLRALALRPQSLAQCRKTVTADLPCPGLESTGSQKR